MFLSSQPTWWVGGRDPHQFRQLIKDGLNDYMHFDATKIRDKLPDHVSGKDLRDIIFKFVMEELGNMMGYEVTKYDLYFSKLTRDSLGVIFLYSNFMNIYYAIFAMAMAGRFCFRGITRTQASILWGTPIAVSAISVQLSALILNNGYSYDEAVKSYCENVDFGRLLYYKSNDTGKRYFVKGFTKFYHLFGYKNSLCPGYGFIQKIGQSLTMELVGHFKNATKIDVKNIKFDSLPAGVDFSK